jgi:hypothetical protein
MRVRLHGGTNDGAEVEIAEGQPVVRMVKRKSLPLGRGAILLPLEKEDYVIEELTDGYRVWFEGHAVKS